METTSRNISELSPDQRQAAEKLLGRSLLNFEKVIVRVLEEGSDIVIRFSGRPRDAASSLAAGKWDIPACFNVLTDLSDAERREFDAVVSQPVTLSRPD
jgi:hypothetical protein